MCTVLSIFLRRANPVPAAMVRTVDLLGTSMVFGYLCMLWCVLYCLLFPQQGKSSAGRHGHDGSRIFWVPLSFFCVPLRDMVCTILSVISLAWQIQCPLPWTGWQEFWVPLGFLPFWVPLRVMVCTVLSVISSVGQIQ